MHRSKMVDWNKDAQDLGMTSEDIKSMAKWLDNKKQTETLHRDLTRAGGKPSDLNSQQFKAFAILSPSTWSFFEKSWKPMKHYEKS